MGMKTRIILVVLTATVLIANVTNAQTLDLKNSPTFTNYNFAIVEQVFNNTPGKTSALATPAEPILIATDNETIAVSLAEWGDDSRFGVIVKISNGSHSALMPLERGWGTQVDERIIGKLKIRVGLMEIFRGRNIEFTRLGIFITKI